MSRKYKVHYENFNRYILRVFMTEKELDELDKKYNEAKVTRELQRLEKKTGIRAEVV